MREATARASGEPLEAGPAARTTPRGRDYRSTAGWVLSTLAIATASYLMALVALWVGDRLTHRPMGIVAVGWDTAWYYALSQTGYPRFASSQAALLARIHGHHPAVLRPAFFPGLPIVERVVHAVVGGPPSHTTLLVGFAGLAASCLLLRLFLGSALGDAVAWRAMTVFAFFVGAYVFVMAYSEAVEIPLAIGTLYLLRRRWYLLAGLVAAAATATRLTGLAVVAACAAAAARELYSAMAARQAGRPVRLAPLVSAVACPVIGLAGLAGFELYLHSRTGSYDSIQTAERLGWGNTATLAAPYRALKAFVVHPGGEPFQTIDAIGVVVVAACLVLLVLDGPKRLGLEATVYAGVVLLAWEFTTNTGAWFRFVESAFPVLVLVVVRLGPRWYPAFVAAGAFALGIFLVMFFSTAVFSP